MIFHLFIVLGSNAWCYVRDGPFYVVVTSCLRGIQTMLDTSGSDGGTTETSIEVAGCLKSAIKRQLVER